MREIRSRKYILSMMIVVLIMLIVGISKIGSIDVQKGLVKVEKVKVDKISMLSANIQEAVSENNDKAKGYDEVKYTIKYNLSDEENIDERPVIIKASLSEDESKYASFKEVNAESIISTISSDKKEITIRQANAKVGEENKIDLIVVITNAPNGYKVNPKIEIKEESEEEYKRVTSKEVEVQTKSIEGIVKDTEGMIVSGLELSLYENGKEIKRTYTDENGKYVFSDIETEDYEIKVEEERYSLENIELKEAGIIDIEVKNVKPYEIQLNKYVNSITINGEKYTYGKVSKVQQAIKRLKNVTGEIEYIIEVKNIGEKEGLITVIKDEIPEGLSFNKDKNSGWEEKEGIVYNRNLEGLSIKGQEKREVKLILDIEKTDEAKTYINKVNAKGEIYEKVVFVLDGETYKEKEILEGEKVQEIKIENEKFSGWYTDKNYTNKYNFDKEVTKDIILYGKTNETKIYNVKYIDNSEIVKEENIEEGTLITPPNVSKEGYTFKYWSKEIDGEEYDILIPIQENLVLYSVYDINEYNVEFYDEGNLKDTIKVNYNNIIDNTKVPEVTKEGYTFVGWYENEATESFDFTTKITRNIKLYSKYEILKNSVVFNDENRITEKEVEYGSVVDPIPDQGKEGHEFSHWSEECGGEPFDFATPIKQTTNLCAVYVIKNYDIVFKNYDGTVLQSEKLDYGTIPQYKAGIPVRESDAEYTYTFIGWDKEITRVVQNEIYVATYTQTKNKYTVTFIDGETEYLVTEVEYGEKVSEPTENPTKEHNIFLNWTLNGNIYDFNSAVTENIVLHSNYELVESPSITHEPNDIWVKDKVVVTISSSHEDYTYKYKIDAGDYIDYEGPFEVEENCTVVAKSIKNGVESDITSHDITNIDKISPTILSFNSSSINETSFNIDISSKDEESGMGTIKLYKDGVYETTISYSENPNETKNSSYSFTGLEDNVTYKVKAVAYDNAGNSSEELEIDVTTETAPVVARIIGRDGALYETEEQYEDFQYLESAVDSCGAVQCSIIMVDNTIESVDVLDGQDVTLDLKGYTVRGAAGSAYTMQNSGNLTVKDTSENTGLIINANEGSRAISNINNAVLQIGENEEELVVSTANPNIVGSSYGVYTDKSATFNFYDGKIEGNTAIQGNVDDTPYLYNANIATENHQIGTLLVLADAEARIVGGKYYTQIANAIGETASGEYVDLTSNVQFLSSFSNAEGSTYGFDYDEATNTLISNNNLSKTSATASTVIDLTNYSEDQYLEITGHLTGIYKYSSYSSSKGTIAISTSDGSYSPNSSLAYDTTTAKTNKIFLKKGYRYTLTLTHNIPGGSSQVSVPDAKFVIDNIQMSNYKEDSLATEKNSSDSVLTHNYGFDYDEETKTYKSNNQYKAGTTAFSYIPIDLTGETKDKKLIVNASLYSNSQNFANIIVNEDNNIATSWNSYGNNVVAYITSNKYNLSEATDSGIHNYTKVLTAGKKYYLQFYYFKTNNNPPQEQYEQYGVTDTFTIHSIDLVDLYDETGEDVISTIEKASDTEYGFSKPGTNYSYYSANNGSVSNSVAHSYVKVDLTSETKDKHASVNVWSSSGTDFYVEITNDESMPNGDNAFINAMQKSYSKSNANIVQLQKGKVNYIHFVYKRGTSGSSPEVYNVNILDGLNIDLSTELRTVGQYGNDKLDSYDNSYTHTKTGQDILNDSYIKIDLTRETEDKIISINYKFYSSESAKYFYITSNVNNVNFNEIKNDKSKALLYYTSDYQYDGYNNYKNYEYVLEKGNVYYLHIAYYGLYPYDSNSYLKSVKLYSASNNSLNIGKYNYNKGSEEIIGRPLPYVMDETDDNNLRYAGKDAKNYIKFNNELWRIIGVFDTEGEDGKTKKRIKIVRDASIGSYSWDSSSSSLPDGNGGYGINEWSQADLMKLLNPGYDDEEIGGSLYWNGDTGSCYSGQNNASTTCDFTSNGLTDTARSMIDTVKWNTAALNNSTLSGSTPLAIYTEERGTTTGKTNYTNTDDFPEDNVERTYNWMGKVGLLSLSDILLATGDTDSYNRTQCINNSSGFTFNACAYNNDWLYQSSQTHLLNPAYGGYPFSGIITSSSFYSSMPVSSTAIVKPVVYLSTKVKLTGEGTAKKPYEIQLLDVDNSDQYYGLKTESYKPDSDSDNVITEEILNDNYTNIKDRTIYGFSYDEETNTYTSETANIPNSLALGYAKIDLTSETNEKTVVIKSAISSTSDQGYLDFMQDNYVPINYSNYSTPPGTRIQQLSGTGNYENKLTLAPGHVYYLQFAYMRNTSSEPTESITNTLKVSIDYIVQTEKTDEYVRYDKTIPVLNEEPDTVQLIKDITLSNSLEINETKNVTLDLNGYTLTTTANDYVIKNNGGLTITDSKYINDLKIAQENYEKEQAQYNEQYERESQEYNKKMEDSNNPSIDNYVKDGLNVQLDGFEYGLDDSKWTDLSNNGNYGIVYGSTYQDNGYYFDGVDDYISLRKMNFNNFTLETTFTPMISDSEEREVVVNFESGGYGIKIQNGYIIGQINISGSYKKIQSKNQYEVGKKYISQLIYDGDTVSLYINGELQDSVSVGGNIVFPEDNTIVVIGSNPRRTAAYENYFKGIVHSVRIYNKALTESQLQTNYNLDEILLSKPILKEATLVTPTQSGNVLSTTNSIIHNTSTGNLNIESGILNLNKSGDYSAITNEGAVKLGKTGIININTGNNSGIKNLQGGIILPGEGTINANYSRQNAIWNSDNEPKEIDGYTINTNNTNSTAYSGSDVILSNFTFTGAGAVVKYSGNGEISINNSVVGSPIYNISTGTINLNNINATSNYSNESTGIININGGNHSGTIENNANGTVNITSNANITSSDNATATINNKDGKINIISGNITSTGGYPIMNYGILNIGEKNGEVNQTNPLIIGDGIGIYNEYKRGTINFYDGTIKGTKAIYGPIKDSEENYDLNIVNENSIEIATLKVPNTPVAKIGEQEFLTLESAIARAATDDEIVLVSDIYTLKEIAIPEGKNISLNLNNHKIDAYKDDKYIINNGSLVIKDSIEKTGQIISNGIKTIENNGELTIENGTIKSEIAVDTLIESKGILTITGGQIYIHSDNNNCGMKLLEGSETTISGGTFILDNEGIKNKNKGILIYNEGNLTINEALITLPRWYEVTGGPINQMYGIYNKGTLSISDKLSGSGYNRVLHNEGEATLEGTKLDFGYVQNYGILQLNNTSMNFQLINNETGTINIEDGKYSAIKNNGSGTINIKNGTNISTDNGVAISNVFSSETGGGTINISNSTIESGGTALSNSNGTINISNTNITSTSVDSRSSAIINQSGVINIISGEIKSTWNSNSAIKNSSGTITIGQKGGEVSQTNPTITGGDYGVYNQTEDGTINFYDGVIIGESSIYGTVANIEDGYEIIQENDTIEVFAVEKKYLANLPVAKIKSTNEEYPTVQRAVDAATVDGETIELLRELTTLPTTESIVIPEGKNVELDLKGFKIQDNNDKFIINNGKLKIKDISDENSGQIISNGIEIIENNGELTIESGTLKSELTVGTLIENKGKLNVIGGQIEVNTDNYGIHLLEGSETTINGGTFVNISGNLITNEGNLIIEQGTINADTYYSPKGIYNKGTLQINDKLSVSIDEKLLLNNEGQATLDGTILESGKIDNKGTLQMNSVTMSYTSTNITNSSSGIVNINGGNYHGSISNSGTTNITGGANITSSSNTISNSGGTINITNDANITSTSDTYSAISNSGTITIGEKDGEVSQTSPSITGKKYGLSGSGIINFYDGVISGEVAISAKVKNIEEGYAIITEKEETVEKKYLANLPVARIKSTNEECSTLQDAVNKATVDGETIEILREITTLSTTESIVIPGEKNIELDLKGLKIEDNNTKFIINNGDLKIKDTSKEKSGQIISSGVKMIENNGKLTLEGGKLEGYIASPLNKDSLIENKNTLIIKGSNLILSGSGNLITNEENLIIEEGTIYMANGSLSSGIYNEGTLQIKDKLIMSSVFYLYNNGQTTLEGTTLDSVDIDNNGTLQMNNVTINSMNYITNRSSGTVEINGGNHRGTIINVDVGTINMNSVDYHGTITNDSSGTINIKNGTNISTDNGIAISNGFSTGTGRGTTNISNSTITSTDDNDYTISNFGGTINVLDGSTITSAGSSAIFNNKNGYKISGTVNIISGEIISTKSPAIKNDCSGTITIGEKDGNVSQTSPLITGATYGVHNSITKGIINFYDGVIKGTTEPIYGTVNEVEPGYKISINTIDNVKNASLAFISDEERVAGMNGINFGDLQSVINAASDTDESTIIVYTNITLDDNIVVPETKNIKLYLNGFTITYNGYDFIRNGTISIIDEAAPTSLLASIVSTVKDVLNIDQLTKNIVIYEMPNGNALSSDRIYKLYEKDDTEYKLQKVEKEEEIGRYIKGNEQEDLRVVKGRLYLNNLTPGEYKIMDDMNNDIEFTITEEGKIIGHVMENNNSVKSDISAEAIAEVIITIVTGVTVGHYGILIFLIITIIILLKLVLKTKKSFE